jgi:hypothetical protein
VITILLKLVLRQAGWGVQPKVPSPPVDPGIDWLVPIT